MPVGNLRKANLIFVELDECQEANDSLRSASVSAANALHSKSLEISTLKDQKLILEQITGNDQVIIRNQKDEIRKQRGLKIGAFVVAVGALIWAVVK